MSQTAPVRPRVAHGTSTLISETTPYSPDSEKTTQRSTRRNTTSLPKPVTNGHATGRNDRHRNTRYPWWRVRLLLSRPLPWLFILFISLIVWWSRGARQDLQSPDVQNKLREMFPPEIVRNLQFYPASNRKVHYVGRWTTSPNRLRVDGAFPGVYFELNVTNTSTVMLSLSNAKPALLKTKTEAVPRADPTKLPTNGQQYSFLSRARVAAPPISLLAMVDGEEYIKLPNASSLVPIRMNDLDRRRSHIIRIIAPMTDDNGQNVVQFDGMWTDKGGQLLAVQGTRAHGLSDEEDDFDAESDSVGEKHRLGLGRLLRYGYGQGKSRGVESHAAVEEEAGEEVFKKRRKLLEIVTDIPVNLRGRSTKTRSGGSDGLLQGVMGWQYLLGEMFNVDHVSVAAEGMCLSHECVGGTGEPSAIGDVFFRSGPVDSIHFSHPWPFASYVPDVLIMNLGSSDHYSINNRIAEYNKTAGQLYRQFEDTYVSLVRAIRTLAYPTHPATLEMHRLGLEAFMDNNAPAQIPIFIMRPLRGEMEHVTQAAVNRLRSEGDKGVFWLDTSGWLDPDNVGGSHADFYQDPNDEEKRYRLTERANQRIAIYLHMHVCRYLAVHVDNCAFLPPEVYVGNVYDPSVATFDRYIEVEKERQMREIFWEAKKSS